MQHHKSKREHTEQIRTLISEFTNRTLTPTESTVKSNNGSPNEAFFKEYDHKDS